MIKTILAAAVAGLFLLTGPAVTPTAHAQQEKTQKAKSAKPKKALTPGQKAARERQKKCGAEWRAAKAAGKIQKGMTWPKYWSACNKRLKGS